MTKSIRLRILPHYIGVDNDAAHVNKPRLSFECCDRLVGKLIDGIHPRAGHLAVLNPILRVNTGNTARLQHPIQFRHKELKLLKETFIPVVVAEVVKVRRILVVIGKRNRRYDFINTIRWPRSQLLHAIIIDRTICLTADLGTIHPHLSFKFHLE